MLLMMVSTILGEHPETRVEEEASMRSGNKNISETNGCSPEVEVCHQGEEMHHLGLHC